jgi:hypothetical protein
MTAVEMVPLKVRQTGPVKTDPGRTAALPAPVGFNVPSRIGSRAGQLPPAELITGHGRDADGTEHQ